MATRTQDGEFLRAIAVTPNDDALRLRYADWLHQRGDPRAEYLQLEIEAISLGPSTGRYAALVQRLRSLEARLDPTWTAQRKGGLWLTRFDERLAFTTLNLIMHALDWPLDRCSNTFSERALPWLLRRNVPWYELVPQVIRLNRQHSDRIVFEAVLRRPPRKKKQEVG
jgi:uncharacterized protein (TIGR02996 family)